MPASSAHLICLTGGVATGKTRVSQWFGSRGWSVLCTDEIVHELYQPENPLPSELADAFGEEILARNGGVDRSILAKIVFNDPAALARLNALVHPRVQEIWQARLDAASGSKAHFMCVIPLAYEAGVTNGFQQVWVVACSTPEQKRRMVARGIAESQLDRRLAAQWPQQKKMDLADRVIWNDGPWAVTEQQLEKMLKG